MSKPLVENRICESCGADVRSGSLFCYNCGQSVAPNFIDAKTNKIKKPDTFDFDQAEKNSSKPTTRLDSDIKEKPVEEPAPKPSEGDEPKLKSAANLRRKSKALPPKKVEIVWEEPESVPNKWFIVVALLLTLFVSAVVLLAIYLN